MNTKMLAAVLARANASPPSHGLLRDAVYEVKEEILRRWGQCLDELVSHRLNDEGRRIARSWLRKYQLHEILAALDIAIDAYVERGSDGNAVPDTIGLAISKVEGIIKNRRDPEGPVLKELYYARGILRNRLSYLNEYDCIRIMRDAVEAGVTTEEIKHIAREVTSWTKFVNRIERATREASDD